MRAQLGCYCKQGVERALTGINKAGGVLTKPLSEVFEDAQDDNSTAALNTVNRLMR